MTILLILISTAYTSFAANIKLAQTGFGFLGVKTDARGSAMAGAMTAVEGYSGSLFYNPAGMTNISGLVEASFGQNTWIADIKHTSLSMAVRPSNGQYGVFGISFQYVDYGTLEGTMIWSNDQGYIDTENFEPSAISMGIGYAKNLTDRFSVGGQIKMVRQSLGRSVIPSDVQNEFLVKRNLADVVAFDFGTLFKTGIKSLAFGMTVRDFSQQINYEIEDFELPLIFNMGISANLMDFIKLGNLDHSLLIDVDATHPRSYREQLKVGLEYCLMKRISLRAGYVSSSDEEKFSYGFGLNYFGITVDYAYSPFKVFDPVQRFTCRLSF
jgi:hypothetical protein